MSKAEPLHPGIVHVYCLKTAVEHAVFVGLVSERPESAEAVSARTRELADELFRLGGALEKHLHQCQPCSYEEMESLAAAWLDEHFAQPVLGIEPPSRWEN